MLASVALITELKDDSEGTLLGEPQRNLNSKIKSATRVDRTIITLDFSIEIFGQVSMPQRQSH